jgi:Skp family chaperone for outer membrane proteins
MKKVLIALVAGLMLAAPMTSMPAMAETKIGVIDVQKILADSSLMKALQGAQQEVAQTEQKLLQVREEKLKQLQEMQKQVAEGKMTQEDFLKKQRQFEDEVMGQVKSEQTKIEKKKEEIRQMKEKLEKAVEESVKKVAGEKGLEIVLNKQMVIFGGEDITADVIKNLPKL